MNAGEWADWIERERAALLRFCGRYLGDARLAEDAVSEVTGRLLAAGAAPDDPRTFARAAARNHCLNLLRARARRPAEEPLTLALAASLTGPLSRLVREERRAELRAELERLDAPTRELLLLRYAEDLSRTEIAAITGLAPSLVKSRLFEGLEKLRAVLEP